MTYLHPNLHPVDWEDRWLMLGVSHDRQVSRLRSWTFRRFPLVVSGFLFPIIVRLFAQCHWLLSFRTNGFESFLSLQMLVSVIVSPTVDRLATATTTTSVVEAPCSTVAMSALASFGPSLSPLFCLFLSRQTLLRSLYCDLLMFFLVCAKTNKTSLHGAR